MHAMQEVCVCTMQNAPAAAAAAATGSRVRQTFSPPNNATLAVYNVYAKT